MGEGLKGTIFVDVDGTLLEHNDLVGSHKDSWLPGAEDKIRGWIKGYHVCLTTSRKSIDSLYNFLEENELDQVVGIVYNLPLGIRYLINDRKYPNQDTAVAFNVKRNVGVKDVPI